MIEGAKMVIAAFRQELPDLQKCLKQFLFAGFKGLTEEELKEFSMTETHILLKCSLANENVDDDEEDLDAGL